jgi:hypothetical protein
MQVVLCVVIEVETCERKLLGVVQQSPLQFIWLVSGGCEYLKWQRKKIDESALLRTFPTSE